MPASKLKAQVERLDPARLDAGLVAQLLGLMQAQFDGVDPQAFAADLAAKQVLLVLRDEDGTVEGFCSFAAWDAEHEGVALRACSFGDTVMSPDAWGASALPQAVMQLLDEERRRCAPRTLHCLYLCSGHRTYHFLRLLCREHGPRPEAPWDPAQRGLRDALAHARYGRQFDAAAGVVRLARGAYRLRDRASVEAALQLPWARYFFEANPGWAEGDELACLALIAPENDTGAAKRLLRAA